MISIDNITIRFGAFTLFDSISFQLNKGDRVGLVGRNGAGKTTIMNLIAGLQKPDEGRIVKGDASDIGYLPQQMKHSGSRSLYEETMQAFGHILKLEKEIHNLTRQLSERTDYESDSYMKLIEKLGTQNDRFEIEGGNAIHADIEKTLIGLGFKPSDMDRSVREFSGGWRMRIELAKILLRKPDYILLDEPTNHLDIDSIQWLESYLSEFSGGVLLISHDRVFLDNVSNRTLDLSLGKVFDYKVGYSEYVQLKEERIEHQMASYSNQQKMIKDTEKFIERFRYKATKAVQVQSRVKQLSKIDRISVEQEDNQVMNLRFPPAKRSGKVVVEAKNLGKAYGDHQVLEAVDLIIERGEKVAFVGRNGEGKTTLSRILVGDLDHSGDLRLGHNVELGYFAQNQDELMNENSTVYDTVDMVAVGDIRTKIRDILGAFLFRGDDIDKKVKVLSGGERSRLAMAVMILQPFNLMILDEPTNHLDMRSKDILKNALLQYDGTLIVVSHDREFLDGLVDKVYEFRNKGIKEYAGGIFDFLEKRKISSIREIERKNQETPVKSSKNGNNSKLQYEEKKELDRKIRKQEKTIKNIESQINVLEEELKVMDEKMADPGNIEDQSLFHSYERKRYELDILMENWEDESSALDNLKTEMN